MQSLMLEDNKNNRQKKGDSQKQVSVEHFFDSGLGINLIVIVSVSPQEGPEPQSQDDEFCNGAFVNHLLNRIFSLRKKLLFAIIRFLWIDYIERIFFQETYSLYSSNNSPKIWSVLKLQPGTEYN